MKKIILTVFAATSLLLYSTPSFALVSVSVGMPMGQTITGKKAGESYGNAPETFAAFNAKNKQAMVIVLKIFARFMEFHY